MNIPISLLDVSLFGGKEEVLRECLLLSGWPGQLNNLTISPLYHDSYC